jgi:iron-sulfur cluster repair protein YtfE (RIC family)
MPACHATLIADMIRAEGSAGERTKADELRHNTHKEITERTLTISNEPYADTRDMYLVHMVFRREFGLLPGLVRGVTPGDKERTLVVADHIALMTLVLHHHHHAEDTHLWPKLLGRGSQDVAAIVHIVEGHHENLEAILGEVDAATRLWRSSAESEYGEALAVALDRLIPPLKEHMDVEEARILPIVEKHITAAEWNQMVEEAGSEIPQETLPLIFGMLMYEGDPDVIQDILSNMPPEVRPVMNEIAPRAFASHSARVHGTATPPRIRV